MGFRTTIHLTDEELLRPRDGEPAEPHAQRHLERCPLCQELLAAWQDFSDLLRKTRPLEEGPKIVEVMAEGALHEKSLRMDSARRYSRALPQPLPEDWIEGLLDRLPSPEPLGDLGVLEVVHTPDGDILLGWEASEGASGGQPSRPTLNAGEAIFRLSEGRLHLSARRAGLQVFLIARWTPWPGPSDIELTLIPARGELRLQPLDHDQPEVDGQAWFALPPGPARLFVHGTDSAVLRIEHRRLPDPGP